MITEAVNIDSVTAWKIFGEDLSMTKFNAYDDPKVLVPDQNEHYKECCSDILQQLQADS